MRYPKYFHTLVVVAIIALSGSLQSTVTTTEALPLSNSALQPFQKQESTVHSPYQLEKRAVGDPIVPTRAPEDPPHKSPNPDPTTNNPRPTQTQRPDPPPSKAPSPSPPTQAPRPPPAQSSQPQPKPSNSPPSHSDSRGSDKPTNTRSGTNSATTSGTSSVASPTDSSSSGNEAGVPTKVSEKVFIGLGTVCGLLVFAFAGVAFCRHQKKKNLAKALLQQTAQFNHNNPYAKISEPMTPAKESLPMTPTKPLGTFNVVAVYTPALADEIEMGVGESVTILQEYDDGWCLGVNNSRNGIEGVFPRHCLEGYQDNSNYGGGGSELGYYPPDGGFKAKANKRMSSIPGGWNNGQGGYNGGGYDNYPPNPIPHQQYNDQSYYNGGGYQ
ncbi:hypothetical protein BGX27_001186 [Mortierella sp. AM989]|nr:hypothetical protein BGX27_001186 [Mortierella sp. AM989]